MKETIKTIEMNKFFLSAIVFSFLSVSPAVAQVVTSGSNIGVGTSTVTGVQTSSNSRTLDIVGVVDVDQGGVTASASGDFTTADLSSSYNADGFGSLDASSAVSPSLGIPEGQAQSSTSFETLQGFGLDYSLNTSSVTDVADAAFTSNTTTNNVSVFGGL